MISRNGWIIFFILSLTIMLIWAALLQTSAQKETIWNYGFNVGYGLIFLIAGLVSLWQFETQKVLNSLSRSFLYLGLGLISFSIALFIWFYLNIFVKTSIPFPSVADFFFVLFYPLTFVGLMYLISAHGNPKSSISSVKALIILTAVALPIIILTSLWSRDDTVTAGAKFFSYLYPVGDILLATMATLLFDITSTRVRKGVLFLIMACLTLVLADLTFAYRSAVNIYWNGDITDVFYAIAGFLFSIGIVSLVSGVINNPIDPNLKD